MARSDRTERTLNDAGGAALGIVFWVAIWFLMAALVGNDLLFANPLETARAFGRSLGEVAFWQAVGATTARILATAALSALAGILLGALAHRFCWVRRLMAPALQVMKSAPVACVIVIVLVAWGSTGALIIIVAFVAFPPFYVSMGQALDDRPHETEEVMRLAGVARWRIFLCCAWPASLPYFMAASKTAVALAWRAGVTAELLCLPLGTIGSAVHASKLTLDSGQLLVWTVMVMVLSWLSEQAVLALLRLSGRAGRMALKARPEASPAPDAPGTLRWDGVQKSYATDVLDGFTLAIHPGQRVCLMAPTGSGKTTALHLALGLAAPEHGQAAAPQRVGAMLQTPTLVTGLTAAQNVMLAAAPGVSEDDAETALQQLLPEGSAHLLPAQLSGGMKRLTELARALLSAGQAIVLDEPFAGLDADSRTRACRFITERLDGRPLIVATHDETDARLLDAQIVRLP